MSTLSTATLLVLISDRKDISCLCSIKGSHSHEKCKYNNGERYRRTTDIRSLFGLLFTQPDSAKSRIVR